MTGARKGLTLIEVVVSFGLAAMVFVIVSAILLSILGSNVKSRRQERFEQVKNNLFIELGNVVRWAEVVVVEPNKLVADTNVYELAGGKILRNGQPITPSSVQIVGFNVEEFMTVPADPSLPVTDSRYGHSLYPGVAVEIAMRDTTDSLTVDTLRLFVAQRKTEVEK